MSQVQRFKFSGSKFYVGTGFAPSSPPKAISGATQAAPIVLHVTGHGLNDGDVVMPNNVLGMTDINGNVYVVDKVDADHISLIDSDGTGYAAWASGGTIEVATYSNFCELTSYNRTGGQSPTIDATAACSTSAEFEVGLPDFGTTAIDFHFAPRTAIQRAIQAAYENGDTVPFRTELPKNGGIRIQMGFITQTSEQASNGTLWAGSMQIKNTGNPVDVEAA